MRENTYKDQPEDSMHSKPASTLDSLSEASPPMLSLFRRMVVTLGVPRSVLLLTALCILLSLALSLGLGLALDASMTVRSLAMAALIPALLAPPLSWVALQLISTLDRSERTQHYLASHDSLTELCNRREFFQRMSRIHDASYSSGQDIWLLMLDLDQFKQLNDRWGHLAGDRAIRLVADICRAETRPTDVVGRYGGDEFALLIVGQERSTVLDLAKRLRERVSATPLVLSDHDRLEIRLSIGLTHIDARGCSLDQAIARADEAMRQAKRLGRNRICIAEGKDCVPLAA
jgi:diguanylate cyclase (GGDEF)-like protein